MPLVRNLNTCICARLFWCDDLNCVVGVLVGVRPHCNSCLCFRHVFGHAFRHVSGRVTGHVCGYVRPHHDSRLRFRNVFSTCGLDMCLDMCFEARLGLGMYLDMSGPTATRVCRNFHRLACRHAYRHALRETNRETIGETRRISASRLLRCHLTLLGTQTPLTACVPAAS